MFSKVSRWISGALGHPNAFMLAFFVVLFWGITGPFFSYSNTWQLVINTGTTIITFLMVFILQNSQTRDTATIQLKLDEIIRSLKDAHNELMKVEELSDEDLDKLLKRYESLASDIKTRLKNGKSDLGCPTI